MATMTTQPTHRYITDGAGATLGEVSIAAGTTRDQIPGLMSGNVCTYHPSTLGHDFVINPGTWAWTGYTPGVYVEVGQFTDIVEPSGGHPRLCVVVDHQTAHSALLVVVQETGPGFFHVFDATLWVLNDGNVGSLSEGCVWPQGTSVQGALSNLATRWRYNADTGWACDKPYMFLEYGWIAMDRLDSGSNGFILSPDRKFIGGTMGGQTTTRQSPTLERISQVLVTGEIAEPGSVGSVTYNPAPEPVPTDTFDNRDEIIESLRGEVRSLKSIHDALQRRVCVATMNHEGCMAGKRSFLLDDCEIDEDIAAEYFEREFNVNGTITIPVTVTVTAINEDAASEQVDDAYNMQDLLNLASPYNGEFTIDDVEEA